ncbi:hypothetical protein TanjilG_09509 [Lupinus angustifolius]|uniref:Protein kinase domain-containing protein n=1 Tax=Lupinus angustifolius TaxID=3871 RepID=A0A4P1RWR6_LUPAN|nr:PREDICTED: probable LRR receptor-like serine/threonine-protein kinase At2g24230 [Lupinus angustifolius]OIW19489.1 hypothetical protein TanjilG_09509 [Lupinus angustifolius]
MGFGVFGSFVVLTLLFKHLASQQPNTDEFFVSEFLHKMGFYNFTASICSWERVSCDANREQVFELNFSGMSLTGPIPDTTIGKLSKLQSLDLSFNKITSLPSDFWGLSSLKTLNLSSNQISDSLNNIGNFGLLETFDLSSNNYSDEIPEAIRSLVKLRVLKLDHNSFSQRITSGILKCKSLVSIDLSSNQLNGTLPDGFGAAFPRLRTLNLAGNNIYGRASDILGLKSIVTLNMSGNLFEGSVIDVFQEHLEVLDLSRNRFQGHIPQVQYNSNYNWSHLVYLDLSENELSGEFFQNLNEPLNLKHLNLAHNRFSRQKFPVVEMFPQLDYLNLSKTSLVGNIPDEISQLSNLNALDLSMNHLTGKVPLLRNKDLQIIDLSNNSLSGEVSPYVLEKLPLMEKYNFSYNNLTFCALEINHDIMQKAFFGSVNSCPIAANPILFKRRATKHKGMKLALVLTFSMICLLAGLLFLAFGCRRKTRMWEVKQSSYREEQNISGPFSFQTDSTTWVADVKQATSVAVVIFEKPLLSITFADLLSATSNFDRDTLLADGKFGPVYRGFLPGGIHVAIKVLVVGSTLTDQEAARELEFLGRIKHPNLVPLTGYCVAGDQRIAIYDYMENGNLQNLLHDLPLGVRSTEDWSTDTWEEADNNGIQNTGSEGLLTAWTFRHKIALGIARALAFLHHGCSPPIIHRDVKASSVYLDYDLEPRLSDFGLAKIFGSGLDEEIARGSPGYVPPEFSQPEFQTPTPKSDVYCFGVVLFELVTGKKPVEDDYPDDMEATLVSWVRGLVRRNQASMAIDPKIRDTGLSEQMEEALKIGYLCTADLPSKRPSMQQIVGLIKDIEPTAN